MNSKILQLALNLFIYDKLWKAENAKKNRAQNPSHMIFYFFKQNQKYHSLFSNKLQGDI